MTGFELTEPWWTERQLEVVQDRERDWQRMNFKPSDMLLIHRGPGQGSIGRQAVPGDEPGPGREIVKDGWDHVHCELCFATIAAAGENPHEGYTDGKTWLCMPCFGKYVGPRLRTDV
jgi:hypothetical protein